MFFLRGPMECMFWIIRVPQLFVHPLPSITSDNREYNVLRKLLCCGVAQSLSRHSPET